MLTKLKYFFRDKILPNRLFLVSKTSTEKSLYLTFDDGPVPEVIESLLELLEKFQAKATFFIIGSRGKRHPELLDKINAQQHSLANHSFSHPCFHKISHLEKCQEIDKTNKIISQITNRRCAIFRAPQGRWDLQLLWHLFQKKITPTHWSRDSLDFKKESAAVIIKRFNTQPVTAGDIILFHDDSTLCIEALSVLIPQWQSQGFTLKALKEYR
jgi:peptidoglycan/xylan/chitin deacetylase (PgdA/CDA1 family)